MALNDSCINFVSAQPVYRADLFPPREVVQVCIRISCTGIWDINQASMVWGNPGSQTQAMTTMDLDNVFPIIINPGDEGTVVYIYWDAIADDANVEDPCQHLIQVGLIPVVPNDPPPPPDDPDPPEVPNIITPVIPPIDPDDPVTDDPGGVGAPTNNPGGVIVDGGGVSNTGAGEDLVVNTGDVVAPGNPDPGGNTIDPNTGVVTPGVINTGNTGDTDLVQNPGGDIAVPVPETPNIRVRPVDQPADPQNGPNPPVFVKPNDTSSTGVAVPRIGDLRQIIAGTTYRPGIPGLRPGGTVTTPGVGQITLIPSELTGDVITSTGDTGVIPGGVFLPGSDSLVQVSASVVPYEMLTYPSIGDVITGRSITPNPNVDINTTEPGGSVDRMDPSVLNVQSPTAGVRREPVSPNPAYSPAKITTNRVPVTPGSGPKSESPASNRVASFNLYATPAIPQNGIEEAGFAAPGGQSFFPSSMRGDVVGDFPVRTQPALFSTPSNQLNVTYGDPGGNVTAGEMPLEALTAPKRDGQMELIVDCHPNHVMEQGKIYAISVHLRNTSAHASSPGLTLVAGILDASTTGFKRLAHQRMNIQPRNSSSISITVPKNHHPGPVQLVAMAYSDDGQVIMSDSKAGYILPEGIKTQDYRPGDMLTTAVMRSLGLNVSHTPLVSGRVFPHRETQYGTDFTASETSVAGAIKISQSAVDRGLNTKVTVTVDPLGTPSVFEFTDRVKVGNADLDPMSHDTAFQVDGITPGTRIRLCVGNQLQEADPKFTWWLFANGLETITGGAVDLTGNGTYLDGHVDTPVSNGLVRLYNKRTTSSVNVSTNNSGVVVIPEVTGDGTGQVPVSINSGTGNLILDALPGDEILVLVPGNDGSFNPDTNFITGAIVAPDTGSVLQPADTGSPVLPVDPETLNPVPPSVLTQGVLVRPGFIQLGENLPYLGSIPVVDDIIIIDNPIITGDVPSAPPVVETALKLPETVEVWSVVCANVCQRPENPCIVDITVKLIGDGTFKLVPELCMFSVNSTDCYDGDWHLLNPIFNDSKFSGFEDFGVSGELQFTFPTDMCDHISSFFSEDKILFRLTFARPQADLTPYGVI